MAKLAGSLMEQESPEYWDTFYKQAKIREESSFCSFVNGFLRSDDMILDVGCGSGRDTFSFAMKGYEVVGIDRSGEAIKNNNDCLECEVNKEKSNVSFLVSDISDEISFHNMVKEISCRAESQNKRLVVYVRFLLHSINEESQEILFRTLAKVLNEGDLLAAEFRTVEDQGLEKIYDNHYRRFIVAEDLLHDLEHKYGFSRQYFVKGRGLSVFNQEDPFVSRIIAVKI